MTKNHSCELGAWLEKVLGEKLAYEAESSVAWMEKTQGQKPTALPSQPTASASENPTVTLARRLLAK